MEAHPAWRNARSDTADPTSTTSNVPPWSNLAKPNRFYTLKQVGRHLKVASAVSFATNVACGWSQTRTVRNTHPQRTVLKNDTYYLLNAHARIEQPSQKTH